MTGPLTEERVRRYTGYISYQFKMGYFSIIIMSNPLKNMALLTQRLIKNLHTSSVYTLTIVFVTFNHSLKSAKEQKRTGHGRTGQGRLMTSVQTEELDAGVRETITLLVITVCRVLITQIGS